MSSTSFAVAARVGAAAAFGAVMFASLGAAAAEVAFAPASAGQPGLAVGADADGVLKAATCARQPCDVRAGVDLGVPRSLRAELGRSRLSVVGIGGGRRAIVVSVPGAPFGQRFEAVVAAAPGAASPRVVFAGLTGLVEGNDGVREGKSVTISEPDARGDRRIVVGVEREDLDLCGRPAVLAPEMLDSKDLVLKPAKMQRLSVAVREQATRLAAVPVASDQAPAQAGLLRALGASSAVGTPAALTDGKRETSWAEGRTGSGRGEFVVLSAPAELPLAGFEIALRAAGAPAADRAAVPRELWLVMRGEVFHVTLPPSAPDAPDARFRVMLPRALRSDCVALVTESAFAERADAAVAVAELSAVSEFEIADPKTLVAALPGGGDRSRAAGAVLRALGTPGFAAVTLGFGALDEGGRRVALDVIDAAPCAASVPLYVEALTGPFATQTRHAQDRLRRCGRASAPLLEAALARVEGRALVGVALELGIVAPDRAVELLTPRLARSSQAERRALRVVLARAAGEPQAAPSARRLMVDAALPALARLDLIRALGDRLSQFQPEASQALRALGQDTSFRTRYLLLGPLSALGAGDLAARAQFARALGDANEPRLRARALELSPRDAAWGAAFVAALADPEVRVRTAAAQALGETRFAAAAAPLARLLDDDAWPLARHAAAEALGQLPSEPRGDQGLRESLEDESPSVRSAGAASLGQRGVRAAAPALRERLTDKDEALGVRAAAASALGALCDAESVDDLDELAQKIKNPLSSLEDRALGEAALRALVRLRPSDLRARLAPLAEGRTARAVRRAEQAAKAGGSCVAP